MMEFTLSRVTISICGLILMAAMIAPVIHVFEESEEQNLQAIADKTAGLIDRFERSKADTMILSMGDILPGPSFSMTMENGILTIDDGERSYRSPLASDITGGTFSHRDMVEIGRTGGGLSAVKLFE